MTQLFNPEKIKIPQKTYSTPIPDYENVYKITKNTNVNIIIKLVR